MSIALPLRLKQGHVWDLCLPREGVLVVLQSLHIVRTTAVVVERIEGECRMSILLEVGDGDGDELLVLARHGGGVQSGADGDSGRRGGGARVRAGVGLEEKKRVFGVQRTGFLSVCGVCVCVCWLSQPMDPIHYSAH